MKKKRERNREKEKVMLSADNHPVTIHSIRLVFRYSSQIPLKRAGGGGDTQKATTIHKCPPSIDRVSKYQQKRGKKS